MIYKALTLVANWDSPAASVVTMVQTKNIKVKKAWSRCHVTIQYRFYFKAVKVHNRNNQFVPENENYINRWEAYGDICGYQSSLSVV